MMGAFWMKITRRRFIRNVSIGAGSFFLAPTKLSSGLLPGLGNGLLEREAAKTKVLGIGGAGCNVVEYMLKSRLAEADFVVADADERSLADVPRANKLLIGEQTKVRPFCSAPPEWCRKAAMDDEQLIRKTLQGSDLVCVVAGMGGGIGTGATPVVLRIAKGMKILTIAVVTRPFPLEGKRSGTIAGKGLEEIGRIADFTVLIPYDRLLCMLAPETTLKEAYQAGTRMLARGVGGIVDLIRSGEQAMLDGDFEYVRPFFAESGLALMGFGIGDTLTKAMETALSCPLLDHEVLRRTEKLFITFTVSNKTILPEFEWAYGLLRDKLREDVNIIWGVGGIKEQPAVTLYATSLIPDPALFV